ncbi:hypothetical protein IW262DRAFT_1469472 [Armillaria fumosa]|nr:hypothetical protein IW262DRAFT_1469472 [Armillaria fumosa]
MTSAESSKTSLTTIVTSISGQLTTHTTDMPTSLASSDVGFSNVNRAALIAGVTTAAIVLGALALGASLTLDGVFFSSLTDLGSFFGSVSCLKRLAVNVVTIGRSDDDAMLQGGLCKELETLKVGTGHLHASWMRSFFGRDGIISLENLRDWSFL